MTQENRSPRSEVEPRAGGVFRATFAPRLDEHLLRFARPFMRDFASLRPPRTSSLVAFSAVAFLAGSPALSQTPDPAGIEFFEKKIRPIFVERCYRCHSPEVDKVKGGFLLDTREHLLKGGDTGAAIVPGDPDKSLLIKAVRY